MVKNPKHPLLRRALTASGIAIAATVLGASSPMASAAPVSDAPVASFTSLDTPANWAVVKEAARTGYVVPAKYAASCGAAQ